MKKKFTLLGLFTVLVLLTSNSYGVTIDYNGANPSDIFGSSYDNPKSTIIDYLNTQYTSSDTLKLLNGNNVNNEIETWFANGAASVILEEIAGYSANTTFGWYNSNTKESGQIFAGPETKGAENAIVFNPTITFGFYIDPNGVVGNRMYTQHSLNSDSDYQLTIFRLNNSNEYILGWEDLDLNGTNGGDRDFQDMIVRVNVNVAPVPEPATMFLFGTGLVGLAGLRLRNKKSNIPLIRKH